MNLWVDTKYLWECVTGLNTTTEKWLTIYLATVRKSYELRDISNVFLFLSGANPKHSLTIPVFFASLQRILHDSVLDLNQNSLV